jgi:mRNA-degrading endonuclease toxin of MazEF toxin-antitoxin module
MQRGDIHHVMLPLPPQATPGATASPSTPTHVQYGPRPCVIIQHSSITANLTTVLVIPITGNQRHQFPCSIFVDPSGENGLTVKSTILTHQLRVVDQRQVRERKGRLEARYRQQLDAELKALLNL